MKYIFFVLTVLILQTAFAQTKNQTSNSTSKGTTENVSGSDWAPSAKNIKPTSAIILPDTTIDVSGAKWAILEMTNYQSSPIIWVVFDNGIRVDLYSLFHTNTRMPQTHNAYIMAAFEYMYRNGFSNVSTYESAETNRYIRFVFKRQ